MERNNNKTVFGIVIGVINSVLKTMGVLAVVCMVLVMVLKKREKDFDVFSDKSLINVLEDVTEISKESKGKIIKNETILSVATVKEIVNDCNKLVTKKYEYADLGKHEESRRIFGKKVPLTTDITYFQYDAVVHVGVDLSELSPIVKAEEKEIVIEIPKAEIISHEIISDSFKYSNVKDSIFTECSPKEFTGEIDKMKKKKEAKLIEEKTVFLEAENDAKRYLTDLLSASGKIDGYKVIINVQ